MRKRTRIVGVNSVPNQFIHGIRDERGSKRFKKIMRNSSRKDTKEIRRIVTTPGYEYWKQSQMRATATEAIRVAHQVVKTFKEEPNSAIFAVGRKGLLAERLVRTACYQLGQKLPPCVCMKAKPATIRQTESFRLGSTVFSGLEGPDREVAFAKGAQALAEHIRASPVYPLLEGKKNIVIIEDFSNQKSQSYYFKAALEKAFPKSKVTLLILLDNPQRGLPRAIWPDELQGEKHVEHFYPSGKVTEHQFNLEDVLNETYWRAFYKDVQAEIKGQLKSPNQK